MSSRIGPTVLSTSRPTGATSDEHTQGSTTLTTEALDLRRPSVHGTSRSRFESADPFSAQSTGLPWITVRPRPDPLVGQSILLERNGPRARLSPSVRSPATCRRSRWCPRAASERAVALAGVGPMGNVRLAFCPALPLAFFGRLLHRYRRQAFESFAEMKRE